MSLRAGVRLGPGVVAGVAGGIVEEVEAPAEVEVGAGAGVGAGPGPGVGAEAGETGREAGVDLEAERIGLADSGLAAREANPAGLDLGLDREGNQSHDSH